MIDVANPVRGNALSLERELDWFNRVLEARISLYFGQECEYGDIHEIAAPDLAGSESEYARLVADCAMGFDERLVLILSLIPHIRPQALDTLFVSNKNFDRGFTEFGGWKAKIHSGFLPTCETAAFVLAGNDLEKRFEITHLFEPECILARRGILRVEHRSPGEPFFSGALMISTGSWM